MVLSAGARRVVAVVGVLGLAAGGQAASGPERRAGGAPTYTVAAGDTLSGLARILGVSVASLAEANRIADRDKVRIGTRLVVPGTSAGPEAVPHHRGGEAGHVHADLLLVSASARRHGPPLPEALLRRPERLALMPLFDDAAGEFGVPADLLKAMTWLESGWQNTKVSSTRALGIGQLMPDTVDFVNGVLLRDRLDPTRPEHNIRMSARFLAYLLHQNRGDTSLALSSYYQGLASVRRRGPIPETKRYVANVLALQKKF